MPVSSDQFLAACRKFQAESGIAVSFYSKGELFGLSWSFDDDDCPPVFVPVLVEYLNAEVVQ